MGWEVGGCITVLQQHPGPRLNIKTVFPSYGIPMLKRRRSRDRLILKKKKKDPYTGKTTSLC